MTETRVVNVQEALASFDETWSPHIVGELNGQHVKLAKLSGEFIWHRHADADEMFFVLRGRLTIRLRDRDIELNEGDFTIIPKGVEHLPIAQPQADVLLFEPAGTLNTGNVRDQRTVDHPRQL